MIKFRVNGVPRKVDVPSDTPLLWVLREELQLTGTKFGCGKGLCGACTVHFNGAPVRSCQLPAAAVANSEIGTIEGLSESGDHPVQQAWQELNVVQCGYCQSGQIMSASALLASNKNPTNDQIDEFMSGNICRCGTYPRIKGAIRKAASQMAKAKSGRSK